MSAKKKRTERDFLRIIFLRGDKTLTCCPLFRVQSPDPAGEGGGGSGREGPNIIAALGVGRPGESHLAGDYGGQRRRRQPQHNGDAGDAGEDGAARVLGEEHQRQENGKIRTWQPAIDHSVVSF